LPDPAGRRRAVSVALSAAILLSILPAATSAASAPRGLDRFLRALGSVESGGNYYAKNPYSGAYGKYQIMPASWRAWAATYLGSSRAAPTPRNQERVARAKVTALHRWLKSWPVVAHWWLTGREVRDPKRWSASARRYVNRVMKLYRGGSKAAPSEPAWAHVDERNAAVAYNGAWATAGLTGYRGGRAAYSEQNRASATVTFTGRAVRWIGPVGPTRGKARVLLDGRVVKTVNLRRGGFSARETLYTAKWGSSARHTLSVVVVGSGRPVAIDEFQVVAPSSGPPAPAVPPPSTSPVVITLAR
jgi:hypothetical protein